MTAGDLFDGYRHGAYDPAGVASANSCRQVLRELCRVAHDAGVAQISTERLADRLGLSLSTVKRALKRLKTDGYIRRPVKGTGNRQGSEPRQSVWVLRPLTDRSGRPLPDHAKIQSGLVKYQQSTRFLALSATLRAEVLAAWHEMNTGLTVVRSRDVLEQPKVPKPDDLMADYQATKRRGRMRSVPVDNSPRAIQQSVSQTQQSASTCTHYTSENKSLPHEPGKQPPDRASQLAALQALIDTETATHCPTWQALKQAI